MKTRPEKKEILGAKEEVFTADDLNLAYNECWNEYEKFLPSEEEIFQLISETIGERFISKALAKRIGK